MELHERHQPTTQAKLDIIAAVNQATIKYNLSFGEIWMILMEIGASHSKGLIRMERSK